MPLWLKILLSVLVLGLVLVVVTVVLAVELFQRGAHALELAGAEGEGFGTTASHGECLQEAVRRSADCEGLGVTCLPQIHTFLWSCLESAGYDPEFCVGVPSPGNGQVAERWGAQVCDHLGRTNDTKCVFVATVVPAFCASR